jgi:hypothetical protein
MVFRYLKWKNVSIWPGGELDEQTDELEILSVQDSTEPPGVFEWIAQVEYSRGLNGNTEPVFLPFDDVVLARQVRNTLKLHLGAKVGALADVEIID